MPQENKDGGTPKLLIETQSLFGGQKTEKVEVDSNRLDPISTAKEHMTASLIHPYAIDALGDAACWLCGSAFIVSICVSTPFLLYFQTPFILAIATLATSALIGFFRCPELSGAIIFRVLLVIAGIVLGGTV
ncbi:hypothetical protein H6F89_27090 [Cyanobacteria bacterium FACHB-63]|nr:hypothetical protein [Cyanobacteria bacterium FACHB-63]